MKKTPSAFLTKKTTARIVEEYRELVRLSFPSNEQLYRIEEILDIAISDTELNNHLCQIDEELFVEISSLENNSTVLQESQVSEQIYIKNSDANDEYFSHVLFPEENSNDLVISHRNGEKNYLSRKKNNKKSTNQTESFSNLIQFPSPEKATNQELVNKSTNIKHRNWSLFIIKNRPITFTVLIVGILTLAVIPKSIYLNNKRDLGEKFSFLTQLFTPSISNASVVEQANGKITKISICNLDSTTLSEEIQDYYALYTELKEKVTSQELQSLEIKMRVRKLQDKAKIQQKQLEQEQKFAEKEKTQAERQYNYEAAQKWKNKANSSLIESRQWLCLGKQVLILSK